MLRFTIGKKIFIGFGFMICLGVFIFFLTHSTVNKSKVTSDRIIYSYNPSVKVLEDFNLLIERSNTLIAKWIYIPTRVDLGKQQLIALIRDEYPELKQDMSKLAVEWSEEEKRLMVSTFLHTDTLFSMYREIMGKLHSFENYDDVATMWMIQSNIEDGEVAQKSGLVLAKLDHLITVQSDNAESANSTMVDSFELLQFVVQYSGLLFLIGGLLIAYFTAKTIVNPINRFKGILLQMAKGIFPNEKVDERDDEIGEMSHALNRLIKALKSTTDFSRKVGAGNFEAIYEPLSDQDKLGHALLKMRDDLKESERILEEKVELRTREVVEQKEELEIQSEKLAELYMDVTDSIRYAKGIQDSIFPDQEEIRKHLPDSFIFFQPKDIVSGDFYYLEEVNLNVLFAAADCTGHGVPGAFMSILGRSLIKQAIHENRLMNPAEILTRLNELASESLHQTYEDSMAKDGMDIAFCSYNKTSNILKFSGAFNPLYLVRNNKLKEYKGNRFPIGIFAGEKLRKFEQHELKMKKGDVIYIFSDGYYDQFGGKYDKKFMVSNFKQLILEISLLPMDEQRKVLSETLAQWMGKKVQIDDMLIMGVRF